jgi:hypothetical protein
MKITEFKQLCNISLRYMGDCALLGITNTGQLYVEEYTDDDFIQHQLTLDGSLLASGLLEIPEILVEPLTPSEHALNFSGGRQRGLREADRVSEWVQALPVMEKMALISQLKLTIPPMLLLGIAESRVLSAAFITDSVAVVCRRVQLAHALAEQHIDAGGLPYDYDTLVLHLAQLYDAENDSIASVAESASGIGGVVLQRPLDCMTHDDKLIIADASDGTQTSRILIYQIMH